MVLELRSGLQLQVDVHEALKAKRIAISQVGQAALVKGAMGADGVFNANVVIRAKGQLLWGEDREK